MLVFSTFVAFVKSQERLCYRLCRCRDALKMVQCWSTETLSALTTRTKGYQLIVQNVGSYAEYMRLSKFFRQVVFKTVGRNCAAKSTQTIPLPEQTMFRYTGLSTALAVFVIAFVGMLVLFLWKHVRSCKTMTQNVSAQTVERPSVRSLPEISQMPAEVLIGQGASATADSVKEESMIPSSTVSFQRNFQNIAESSTALKAADFTKRDDVEFSSMPMSFTPLPPSSKRHITASQLADSERLVARNYRYDEVNKL